VVHLDALYGTPQATPRAPSSGCAGRPAVAPVLPQAALERGERRRCGTDDALACKVGGGGEGIEPPGFLRASNQRLTAMPTASPHVDPDRQGEVRWREEEVAESRHSVMSGLPPSARQGPPSRRGALRGPAPRPRPAWLSDMARVSPTGTEVASLIAGAALCGRRRGSRWRIAAVGVALPGRKPALQVAGSGDHIVLVERAGAGHGVAQVAGHLGAEAGEVVLSVPPAVVQPPIARCEPIIGQNKPWLLWYRLPVMEPGPGGAPRTARLVGVRPGL
jgi:hypothetical protein